MAKTRIGRNLTASIDGNVLTLQAKLSAKGTKSGSGKSRVLAKTKDRVMFLEPLGKEYGRFGLIFNLFDSGGSKKRKTTKKSKPAKRSKK